MYFLHCPPLIPNDPNCQTNAQTSFLGHKRRCLDTFPDKNGAFLTFTDHHLISGWLGLKFQLFLIMDMIRISTSAKPVAKNTQAKKGATCLSLTVLTSTSSAAGHKVGNQRFQC